MPLKKIKLDKNTIDEKFPMRTRRFVYAIVLVASSLSAVFEPASAEKIDKIVAIVNGDVITEEELETFEKMELMDAQAPDLRGVDPEEMSRTFLERMIEDRLIIQEARKLQAKPNETLIEDRIKDIKFRAGGDVAFEKALSSQGLTLNEVREKLGNQFLIYAMVEKEVKNKIRISPREVTEYYEKHKADFMTPETAVVDSIFIKDKEKLALAQNELGAGKDFMEVAREYSLKDSLGPVGRGQFKKNLEDFIFNLKSGVPSRPFETQEGFYIFLVREKLPPSQRLLESVRSSIAARIETEKTERQLKEWLEKLKERAYISIRK